MESLKTDQSYQFCNRNNLFGRTPIVSKGTVVEYVFIETAGGISLQLFLQGTGKQFYHHLGFEDMEKFKEFLEKTKL